MKGHNKCQWLRLGSSELCGKSCIGQFCKVHNVYLRKGSSNIACQECGIGVKTSLALCKSCGYYKYYQRLAYKRKCEFRRLATIQP